MARAKKGAKSKKAAKTPKKVGIRDLGPKGGVVKGGAKPLLPAI